jgi:methionyl-tRNA formyltransferase
MVSGSSLRVIYFGTPAFAVPALQALIDSRHRVVALVSQPDRPRGRGQQLMPTPTKRVALDHAIPILQPDRLRDDRFMTEVSGLSPDLGVVAAYGKLLPEALLQIPRFGMINVHASLLPRWRGAAPVHRAVMAGEAVTGVTIMRVVKELDAGATFAERSRPIGGDETSPVVEADLAALGAGLLMEVVDRIAGGTAVETPQDETLVTYAPKITRDEGLVDWARPAAQIHNLVRGLQPWPMVSARLAGERLLIHQTRPTDETSGAAPGAVVVAGSEGLGVAAGDGRVLRVLRLQPEGRRVMSAREFLAGRRITRGLRFERG